MYKKYPKPWLQVDPTGFIGSKVNVRKGRVTITNWGNHINGDVEIGEGCLFGPGVIVSSTGHMIEGKTPVKDQPSTSKKIVIGDHVWVGAGAIILGGTTIGTGAIIGAGAVLLEDTVVGEYEIWAGNPGKFIKKRE